MTQDTHVSHDSDGAAEAIPSQAVTRPRHPRENLRFGAVTVWLLVWLVLACAWSRHQALITPTFHLDGAFQVYSSMHRLGAGEMPGRDFLPYLGVGPVLLVYPAFALFGSTVASSVLSAHLVTLACISFSVAALASLTFPRHRARAFTIAGSIPLILLALTSWTNLPRGELAHGIGVDTFVEFLVPGNSLRPVRSVAPYALGVLLLLATRTSAGLLWWFVAGAAGGAVGALWSNDYGLISSGLFLVLAAAVAVCERDARWRRIVVLSGGVVAGSLGLGLAVTAGRLSDVWAYNLRDVRPDQFWYFGGWREGSHISGVPELARAMWLEGAWPGVALLALLLVLLVRQRSARLLALSYIGLAVLAGGVVGTVGGHVGGYFGAFRVWSLTMGVLLLLRGGHVLAQWMPALRTSVRYRATGNPRMIAGRNRGALGALCVGLVVLTAAVPVSESALRAERESLANRDDVEFNEALGGYLPSPWQKHLRVVEQSTSVVEEYAGLASAVAAPPTAEVDSVIHALGKQRGAFEQLVREQPELVVTSAPDLGPWVGWSLSANWWFYRTLFHDYVPELTSPTTVTWRPSAAATTWQRTTCTVDPVTGMAVLAAEGRGLYDVELEYDGPGPEARAYTLVRNNLNWAADADGYVALDPAAHRQRVPVYVHQPGTVVLDTADFGTVAQQPVTEITGCQAQALLVTDRSSAAYAVYDVLFNPVFG